MNLAVIENIIFDFGGVLIDIDYNRTRKAFVNLGLEDFDRHFSQFRQLPVFDLYETGRISTNEFFNVIEKHFPDPPPREKIEDAWNAMLGYFPPENLVLLKQIRNRYDIYMLSNTNSSHIRYYYGRLKEWYGLEGMEGFFKNTYLSHQIHMRKPDREVFEYIINENRLDPQKTLFIDDSPQHIEGARQTGLQTYHLTHGEKVTDLFKPKLSDSAQSTKEM